MTKMQNKEFYLTPDQYERVVKIAKELKKSTDRFVEDIIGWFDCDCFTVDEIISDYEKELLIK